MSIMYNFTENNLSVTVKEAGDFCQVSETTIRKAIKTYNMHTWKDDRGVIHIRSLDLLKYYRHKCDVKLRTMEAKLRTLVHKRRVAFEKYDDLRREYDFQLEGEAHGVTRKDIQNALDEVDKMHQEVSDASFELYVFLVNDCSWI